MRRPDLRGINVWGGPFPSPAEQQRIDRTNAAPREATDAALEDIASGNVGRLATLRYVEGERYWLSLYDTALRLHGCERKNGKIVEMAKTALDRVVEEAE